MMKKTIALLAACLGAPMATLVARPVSVQGTYVEARTAEVFAGGCIVNGEADTTGREAILAWKITHGAIDGVALDGLAVVAAISGDANLGIHEIGGQVARTRSAIFVDARATPVQRDAIVAMVKALSGTVGTVVQVIPAPVEFADEARDIRVTTTLLRLVVNKELNHDPICGNKQWFGPLSTVDHADLGTTIENAFAGGSLGPRWSDPNKRSAFFGSFSY